MLRAYLLLHQGQHHRMMCNDSTMACEGTPVRRRRWKLHCKAQLLRLSIVCLSIVGAARRSCEC